MLESGIESGSKALRLTLYTLVVGLFGFGPGTESAEAGRGSVADGAARFEIITPTLIRLQYAEDGHFEGRRTQTTEGRLPGSARFTTRVKNGVRVIRTSRLTLRWKRGSGPFGEGGLRVKTGRQKLRPSLGPNPSPLGGWRRSLDLVDSRVPLHEGMLSRDGWYLLDDSETALITGEGFRVRPKRDGAYQDLYLFAYGRDYRRGLRDLRKLTGPSPMLPRKAFGVWFSRWWPYSASDWRDLVQRFRAERVPLDTISVDTDFKAVHDETGAAIAANAVGAPNSNYSWNAWAWNDELYPDPAAFMRWARSAGLEIGLNIHPSISSADPRFPEAQRTAGGGLTASDGCRLVQADPEGLCMVFDWADARQLEAYFDLHEVFEKSGPVFWWLDWCCDLSSVDAPGLTPDTWINRHYWERTRARGIRWPAFSRIGGSLQAGFDGAVGNGAFAEHRHTLHFTGDTCATWELLAFASEFTAAAASIGQPYVSHDIGTFHSESPTGTCDKDLSPFLSPRENSLTPEMYTRWMQLGTFQPFDRLHSHHGRRLPWEYPARVEGITKNFLRLRGQLVPYLYGLSRKAHRTGVPMARPLYLSWPGRDQAYEHPSQYTLGNDVVVAPVAQPGDPAETTVWIPPGTWIDWFTGERFRGPAVERMQVPLERIPVLVRQGSIVPLQPKMATTPEGPPKKLILNAHAGRGSANVYDDSGRGFAYERGKFTQTRIRQRRGRGVHRVVIGPAQGDFGSALDRRRWKLRLIGVPRPERVTVDGYEVERWRYNARTRTVGVATGPRPTDRRFGIVVR